MFLKYSKDFSASCQMNSKLYDCHFEWFHTSWRFFFARNVGESGVLKKKTRKRIVAGIITHGTVK